MMILQTDENIIYASIKNIISKAVDEEANQIDLIFNLPEKCHNQEFEYMDL